MDIIGIVAEYNPFHNGHLYQIQKIKEMYPNSLLIAVISSSFCQRGEISLINKWDKTSIALENSIDIVIELPFVFSTQSADIFAKGALKILNTMQCNKIVFGSETNDLKTLTSLAEYQVKDKEFDKKIKPEIKKGLNYPTAVSNILKEKFKIKIDTPNDLLAISYIKEIIKNNYPIEAISLKRTNSYHSKNINSKIISATAIRELIKNNKSIKKYVPFNTKKYKIYNPLYMNLLKYKINIDKNNLKNYQTVDEGIEERIYKYINISSNKEELISKIKTKRYTYNKINRMLIHILTSLTKEECNNISITYIRLLGFNKKGQNYLKEIKKEIKIPLITSYKNINDKILDIEKRVTNIYSIIVNDSSLIKRELEKPIIK